jgi:hypothetical protein
MLQNVLEVYGTRAKETSLRLRWPTYGVGGGERRGRRPKISPWAKLDAAWLKFLNMLWSSSTRFSYMQFDSWLDGNSKRKNIKHSAF